MTDTQHFDLRAARYLRSVLQTGGFSAAAAAHHRTQQAVSKAIARFEAALGVELINRHLTQLTPTPAGQVVLQRLDKIELELAALATDLEELRGDHRPRMNVGLGLSADSCAAGRLLLEQIASEGDIALAVDTGTSLEMVPELARGALDMVVALDLGGAVPAHSRIERHILGSDRFRLVVAGDEPVGPATEPTLQELARRPWVIGRHLDVLQRDVWERIRSMGVATPRSISSSSLTFVLEAVLRHGYVSILPESILSASIPCSGLRFLALPGCHWDLPLCLYVNRQSIKRPCVAQAVAALQAARMPAY